MVFILVKSHSISPICLQCIMKKALLLHQFCKASFDHLFDNLKSGKILNYSCFGKNSGKSLEFWIEKSVRTQLRVMINSCSKSCLFVLRCLWLVHVGWWYHWNAGTWWEWRGECSKICRSIIVKGRLESCLWSGAYHFLNK